MREKRLGFVEEICKVIKREDKREDKRDDKRN
jgi:hypothetical protein